MARTNDLSDIIERALSEDSSDIHLAMGEVPAVRIAGSLVYLNKRDPVSEADMERFLDELLSSSRRDTFESQGQVDFSYTYKDTARFRGNAYVHREGTSIALRIIPNTIYGLEELHLPTELERFAYLKQGFFLSVGPVGAGKTTTLAALIDLVNRERAEHIISIEDPIEYTFESKQSLVHQREVPDDTPSFADGLQAVFREDVDVIMLGEMRDPETMSAAITAAETGHLVFSTLHTNDAPQTIDRIIDSFPPEQQSQVRLQLSGSLAGIFSQRLVPRISGGLVPAYELLANTKAVSNLIREGRTQEVQTVIETGAEQGMVTMNQTLGDLVRRGEITTEDARAYSPDVRELERRI